MRKINSPLKKKRKVQIRPVTSPLKDLQHLTDILIKDLFLSDTDQSSFSPHRHTQLLRVSR